MPHAGQESQRRAGILGGRGDSHSLDSCFLKWYHYHRKHWRGASSESLAGTSFVVEEL